MNALNQLRARWATLEARERRLVAIGAGLVLVALVWWIALAPALKTLREAPAEHAKVDAQLQQMTTLQAQAKTLQSQPRANRDESMRALEGSVRAGLGATAQIQQQGGGEGVNVVIRAVPAEALAQWLAQARGNARAVPREVHLTRAGAAATNNQSSGTAAGGAPSAAAAGASDKANWDGSLVMSLPGSR
jgi:general secretion pathway protein M